MPSSNYNAFDKDNKHDDSQSSSNKKGKIIFITIFTVVVFIAEMLLRAPLTNLSEYIQSQLNFESKCSLGSLFVWFKYQGKSFLFLLVYNICNVYVSLSMIFLDSFGIFINGIFKLFYDDPRPFWRNENLVPCTCATNYGTPSTTSLDEYLVCIVIFRALINRYKNIFWKIFVWICFITPQALSWASRFMQNVHSIPQLLFGLAIGYIIQYIYYEILEVNMEDSKQFKKIMNASSFSIIVAITLSAFALHNIIHYYLFVDPPNTEYLVNITKYCSTDVALVMFGNESYQKATQAFLFLGSIIGAFIEYRMHFDSNYEKYEKFAMGEDNWTNTQWWKVLIRIFIVLWINGNIIGHFAYGNKVTDSLPTVIFGRCILKAFVQGLFYFWINKVIFGLFCLSNEHSLEVKPKELA